MGSLNLFNFIIIQSQVTSSMGCFWHDLFFTTDVLCYQSQKLIKCKLVVSSDEINRCVLVLLLVCGSIFPTTENYYCGERWKRFIRIAFNNVKHIGLQIFSFFESPESTVRWQSGMECWQLTMRTFRINVNEFVYVSEWHANVDNWMDFDFDEFFQPKKNKLLIHCSNFISHIPLMIIFRINKNSNPICKRIFCIWFMMKSLPVKLIYRNQSGCDCDVFYKWIRKKVTKPEIMNYYFENKNCFQAQLLHWKRQWSLNQTIRLQL